jgi:hypothetical protein
MEVPARAGEKSMSELVLTPTVPREEVVGTGSRIEGVAPVPATEKSAPVLITTQEVMFATGAVAPKSTTSRTGWWTAIARYLTTAADASATDDERRTPRHYPPRKYSYLEGAAMRRALERL